MLRADDHAYYSRRAAQEIEWGDRAIDAAIAALHYELSKRYSILARQTGVGTPQLTLVDGGGEVVRGPKSNGSCDIWSEGIKVGRVS